MTAFGLFHSLTAAPAMPRLFFICCRQFSCGISSSTIKGNRCWRAGWHVLKRQLGVISSMTPYRASTSAKPSFNQFQALTKHYQQQLLLLWRREHGTEFTDLASLHSCQSLASSSLSSLPASTASAVEMCSVLTRLE